MKTAWALGAAFVAIVLVLLVFAVLATEMGSAERLSSTETLEGIDVPVIGTVGDFPDPAYRVVVNVTADGTIVVDGKTMTFAEMSAELKRRVALSGFAVRAGAGKPDLMVTNESVVLRLDGVLPWGAGLDVYGACETAGFRFIAFAVRDETTGSDSALAFFSWEMGDPDDDMMDSGDHDRARGVFAVVGPGDGSAGGLYATLAASRPPDLRGMVVYLDLDPRFPTRTALSLLDASLRAGMRWGMFVRPGAGHAGLAPEDARVCRIEDFETELRRPRVANTTFALAIRNGLLTSLLVPSGRAMPPIARIRGRAVGITWGRDHFGPR